MPRLNMKLATVLKLMRFWPPFFGAGISVQSFNDTLTQITVQMKQRFWNNNYVGTHFGGSLYSMTDPFYMLMLLHAIGKDYIVWDKSASIVYKKPAKGTVFASFSLLPEQVESIKTALLDNPKTDREFIIQIKDSSNQVVAEVKKILHIRKKS